MPRCTCSIHDPQPCRVCTFILEQRRTEYDANLHRQIDLHYRRVMRLLGLEEGDL